MRLEEYRPCRGLTLLVKSMNRACQVGTFNWRVNETWHECKTCERWAGLLNGKLRECGNGARRQKNEGNVRRESHLLKMTKCWAVEYLYVETVLHMGTHTMGRCEVGASWMKQQVDLASRCPKRWTNHHIIKALQWWQKSFKEVSKCSCELESELTWKGLKFGKV